MVAQAAGQAAGHRLLLQVRPALAARQRSMHCVPSLPAGDGEGEALDFEACTLESLAICSAEMPWSACAWCSKPRQRVP